MSLSGTSLDGATAPIAPTVVPTQIVRFDNVVKVADSLLVFLFAWTGYRVGRRQGALLMVGYLVYLAVLWPS